MVADRGAVAIFWVSVFIMATFMGAPVRAGGPIIPKSAKLELIFGGGCMLTEGVAAGPDGMIYFSDITVTSQCHDATGKFSGAGNIWRLDPATNRAVIFRSPSGMSNGMKFDADGNLVIAEGADFGGRDIVRTDMKTGRSIILAGLYEGRPFNSPNDLVIDRRGRIYFTDPRYFGHEAIEQPVQGVYRIDPDGKVTRIIADAGKPNGVAISPDQKTLYVNDQDNGSFEMLDAATPVHRGRNALLAYDLAPDGTATNGRVLVDWSPYDGGDGMTIDADGNLYVAVDDARAPGIYIYSPRGKSLGMISTGKDLPQNVTFGYGVDADLLYVAAGHSIYKIRLNARGAHQGQGY